MPRPLVRLWQVRAVISVAGRQVAQRGAFIACLLADSHVLLSFSPTAILHVSSNKKRIRGIDMRGGFLLLATALGLSFASPATAQPNRVRPPLALSAGQSASGELTPLDN